MIGKQRIELESVYEKVADEEETFYECYSNGEIVRYKTLTDAKEVQDMYPNEEWTIKRITITKEIIKS